MRLRDITPGATVYHTIFTHWGKGTVIEVRGVCLLESIFERGKYRVNVQFDGRDGHDVLKPNELRKTPNRKKIRAMVELYKRRGVEAIDGGDRLILPTD